jgi:hypothetical protein
VSLQSWLQNAWLVQHTTSPEEIRNLLSISDRDLAACQVKQLPADWRFAIAYNAGLQAATAALAAAGYRAARDNHHYRVIQSLEFTTVPGRKVIDAFDGFRKKRNISSYDVVGRLRQRSARDAQARAQPSCECRKMDQSEPSGTAYTIARREIAILQATRLQPWSREGARRERAKRITMRSTNLSPLTAQSQPLHNPAHPAP